jgi:putative CocE/NonD family hydrolase
MPKLASAAVAAVIAVLAAAPAASADPVTMCNVAIPMSDGVTLRANVIRPADGVRTPTALTVTGYNKDAANPTGSNCNNSGALVGVNQALLKAGYTVMIVDDRGTGASQGRWDSWGQRTQDDYPEVLDWIQAQPWSNGKVATTGTSYMGITSLLVAEADAARVKAGKPRAVRTVWADVPMADAYRDVTFHGGSTDSGFIPLWLGLVNVLSDVPPSTWSTEPGDAASTYPEHVTGSGLFAGGKIAEATLGGDARYDGPFYRLRSPVERIKSLKIPVAWTGGWWDLFQRGEPLLYEKMTHSKQRKFWMIPMYHGAPTASIWEGQKIGTLDEVRVRWFDRWVKKTKNGADKLPPVNLYTMGTNKWEHPATWPVPGTSYTRYYLGDDHGLGTGVPGKGAADEAPLLPVSSPCSRMTAQWTAGEASFCDTDNSSWEATSLTYTTKPLERDTQITGLITADLWAELTSTDATLVAVLSDVDGSKSTQVTSGFLLASQRANDLTRSKRTKKGTILRPWHPFTKESQRPVAPNEAERYLIEIYPTSQVFKKGHSIRLTIGTANTPATSTPVPDLVNEAGGQIRLLRGPKYRSNVLLPLLGR